MSTPPRSDDLFREIGRVTVMAARLEMAVGSLYAVLLDSDVGGLVAFGQPWRAVVDGCRAVMEHVDIGPFGAPIPGLLRRAEAVYDQRNQIVHGVWYAGGRREGKDLSIRMKRYGKRDERKWTVDEVRAVADELHAVTEAIIERVFWLDKRTDES